MRPATGFITFRLRRGTDPDQPDDRHGDRFSNRNTVFQPDDHCYYAPRRFADAERNRHTDNSTADRSRNSDSHPYESPSNANAQPDCCPYTD